MKTRFFKVVFIMVLIASAILPAASVQAIGQMIWPHVYVQAVKLPSFSDFVESVSDGSKNVVRGVYVPDGFAFLVVQQQDGKNDSVSTESNVVTQFSLANQNGVTGLLAHNYLAGYFFSSLNVGQEVRIVFGDGSVAYYQVSSVYKYQAINPSSATSDLIDLATGVKYTAGQIFNQFYFGTDHVTFQTCITKGNDQSWGRLFVVALPVKTRIDIFRSK